MFSIGDTVFYNAHGVCSIEDIKEQKFGTETKLYYILRSHHTTSVKLYHPVDPEKCKLKKMMTAERADELLRVFEEPADEWYERNTERNQNYQKALKSENHKEIAKMVNTLLRRQQELALEEKKLPSQDAQMLQRVLPILEEELSIALNIPHQEVAKLIEEKIEQSTGSLSQK